MKTVSAQDKHSGLFNHIFVCFNILSIMRSSMSNENHTTYYSWLKEQLEANKWNIDTLMSQCHNQETEYLEFKATVFAETAIDKKENERQDDFSWHILKAIIAFANGTGGCVLLGVDDDGQPVDLLDRHTLQAIGDNLDKYKREVRDILLSKQTFSLCPSRGDSRKQLELNNSVVEQVEIHQGTCHGKTILCLLVDQYGANDHDFILVKDKQLAREILLVRAKGDIGRTRELMTYSEMQAYQRPYPLRKDSYIFNNFQDPNRSFTGRINELDNLDCILRTIPHRIPIIHGSAGVGKTELSIMYAKRYQHFYPGGLIFIHAEGYRSLCDAFANAFRSQEICQHFNIDVFSKVQSNERYMADYLLPAFDKLTLDVLILLDNVDYPAMLSNAEFDTYLPEHYRQKIHIFATTRQNSLVLQKDDIAVAFKLDGLTGEDGLTLLQNKKAFATESERKAAMEIVDYSKGNAWILDLLGESIKQNSEDDANDYQYTLSRLKSLPFETLHTAEGVRIKHNVLNALELLRPTLDKLNDESLRVLQYSSICTPECVYIDWLQRAYEQYVGHELNLREWKQIIRPLKEHHLWTENNETNYEKHPSIRLHRLTQVVVKKYERQNVGFHESIKLFLNAMGNYVHEKDFTFSETCSLALAFCQWITSEWKVESLPILYSLTPEKDLGDFLSHFQLYDLRRTIAGNAETTISNLPDSHPLKKRYQASSYLYQGHIQLADNHISKALELYQKALAIRIAEFGTEHECTGLLYSYIGSALAANGDTKPAKECFQKSIQIQEAFYKRSKNQPDNDNLAVAQETLVRLYRRCAEAFPEYLKPYYESAIQLSTDLANKHPQNNLLLGETHLHYADRLQQNGNTPQALKHYKIALDIYSDYLSQSDAILKEITTKIHTLSKS